jgi:hypothetical protein
MLSVLAKTTLCQQQMVISQSLKEADRRPVFTEVVYSTFLSKSLLIF